MREKMHLPRLGEVLTERQLLPRRGAPRPRAAERRQHLDSVLMHRDDERGCFSVEFELWDSRGRGREEGCA